MPTNVTESPSARKISTRTSCLSKWNFLKILNDFRLTFFKYFEVHVKLRKFQKFFEEWVIA